MWQCGTYFLLGATLPVASKVARPAARAAIKNGIRLRRQLEVTASRLRDDLADLAAEAAAELDAAELESVAVETTEAAAGA